MKALETTTGQKKDLDSVMVGIHYTIGELIRDIALHYQPPPAFLVDPMCGNGVFYRSWQPKDYGYKTYFSDVEQTKQSKHVHDVRNLQEHFSGQADLIISDPPYPIAEAGNWSKKKNLKRRYVASQIKTKGDYERFIKELNQIFRRIINDKGILIHKAQDVHRKGKFIPYHILVCDWFTNFKLFDIVIYRNFYNRAPWKSKYAHNTHSYFLIFKPRLNHRLNELTEGKKR